MRGTKEGKNRAGLFLLIALAALGLLLAFLFDGEPSDEETETAALQREAVVELERRPPADLDRLPAVQEPERAEAARAVALEPEKKKKSTGTITITAEGPEGLAASFSLALAKIEEAKGEIRVFTRPQAAQSPWESRELSPGLWRVCAFRLVERQAGFPFLLEETSVDVPVREGEATEIGLSFSRDPAPVGALEGAVLLSGVPPQAPNKRRPRRGPYRDPKTVVGLWDKRGKLVDTVDVRGALLRNGRNRFSFSQLPKGEHTIGVMWACDEVLGWPSGEAQSVSAPSLQLALSSKAREAFSKVIFLSEDPVQGLPKKIHVTTVVDGRVAGGELTIEGGDYSVHTPPLEEHEVQWLVRAQGYKTELVSEESLLFFAEEPSVPLSLEKGRSLAAVAVPCSLAEVLIYNDPGFLLASCGGLEGVELRRGGASLGVTGSTGIILLPAFSRGALTTVRPASSQLLVLDESGLPLTRKMNELYVMPLVLR